MRRGMGNGLWTRPISFTIRKAPSKSPPLRSFSSFGWMRLYVFAGPVSAPSASSAERKPKDEGVDDHPQKDGCHRRYRADAANGRGIAIPLSRLSDLVPGSFVYGSRRRSLRAHRCLSELGWVESPSAGRSG